MSSDPAFLFYPGDYLRDTQCLSEKSQVAYDRIMCEHMRNISKDMSKIGVSQHTFNFLTKRLSEEEKEDIYHILDKKDKIFHIKWVAESIAKRKSYTDSRSKNRSKKSMKTYDQHMKTYDQHMENENENEKEDINAREEKFKIEVNNHIEYSDELRDNFIRYWTEKNPKGRKMRFEMQKTFEISKRLATFRKNETKWAPFQKESMEDTFARKRRERGLEA